MGSGRNEAIPCMPFEELCQLCGDAIKSVKSESVKKSFRHTLWSLAPDGSEDKEEGSQRLLNLIENAPPFEELPEKYKFEVIACAIGKSNLQN